MSKGTTLRGQPYIKEVTLSEDQTVAILAVDATGKVVTRPAITAPLTNTLTSAHLFVGNVSNVATDVAVTGDVTITNAGVTAIGSGKIVNANVNASAAIAVSKLAAQTASRVAVYDSSGFLAASSVTAAALQSNALNSGNIWVGNVSNVAAAVVMSGDATLSNAGVLAIGSNKVTVGMQAQLAALSVLGNGTNATANNAAITGTADQVLRVNAAGNALAFGTVSLTAGVAGILPIANGGTGVALTSKYVAKTGTYTITEADYTVDCTSGTFTTTLRTAVGITGQEFVVINSGAGTITLATTSSQTIGNTGSDPTTQTISAGTSLRVISTGANWRIV